MIEACYLARPFEPRIYWQSLIKSVIKSSDGSDEPLHHRAAWLVHFYTFRFVAMFGLFE